MGRARDLLRGQRPVADQLAGLLAGQRTIILQNGRLLDQQRALTDQIGKLMSLSQDLSDEITALGSAIDALSAVQIPTDVNDITQGQLDALQAQIARIVALGQAAPEVPTDDGISDTASGQTVPPDSATAAPSGDVDPGVSTS
jgi:hypothetical protein